MSDTLPIYNSRLTKAYLEYLRHHHPQVNIEAILDYAGMLAGQVAEPGHWFAQQQVDLFQEAMIKATGDTAIARKSGRFFALSKEMGPLKQYTLGLLGLKAIYMLVETMHPMLTRGAEAKTFSLGTHSVAIVCTPNPGVQEKPYQCENRIGTFESLAQLFTPDLAQVDHPQCIHRGDGCCRYIVSWEVSTAQRWKRVRNIALWVGVPMMAAIAVIVPGDAWLIGFLAYTASVLMLNDFALAKRNAELECTIKAQGSAAKDHLNAMNIRYNNALLIQEIGQATASILDQHGLIRQIVKAMEKRLDFDRGMIMLADQDARWLSFAGGYGYGPEHAQMLEQTTFCLDNSTSRGLFVKVFRDCKPALIDDIDSIEKDLSSHSLAFARRIKARSLICVPLVYENQSVGILVVDNIATKRPLTQSDVSLLMGIASQTAVSLSNARSFQKLLESETKYRELVENANSIILRCNVEGRVMFFNEFAQRFFGIGEADIIGTPILGSILPDNEENRAHLEQLLASAHQDQDRPIVTEGQSRLPNGAHVWIAWTYKPIFDQKGCISEVLCIGNDLTLLKKANQEKADLENRLQLARKMEAIGTLAGGVAHDLNNILAGIVGYPELLLMDMPPGHSMRKAVETIKKSGEKASLIVQDLLTLARRGVAAKETVDLNQIIIEYLSSPEYVQLKRLNPKTRVNLILDQRLPTISGSPVHLSKTVMNLVSNAYEAMPEGGELTLSTRHRYLSEPIKGFNRMVPGHFVVFTVADSGIGIHEQDIERIFEPFYTKKKMGRSGTGLGMAVVWGTVQDHGGHIDINSQVGKGTCFTLTFPAMERTITAAASTQPADAIMGKGETILVVDDMADQRELACKMLELLGYNVDCVASGEEALVYLQQASADVLVLDMIMDPGMDGLETYKKVLEHNPHQRAIFASGYAHPQRVNEALVLGAGGFVKKPYVIKTLGGAVRKELDRQTEGAPMHSNQRCAG